MTAKKPIDWEAVEHDYRAGLLSLREMAESHGVSHVMISKKAKTLGWVRDLKAKIQAKAEALVNSQAVTSEVNDREAAVTERQIIEANATRIAQVRGEHRRDIKRTRELFLGLMGQLETVSSAEGKTLLGQLFTIIHSPTDDPEDQDGKKRANKMAEMLDKVLSLPSNVDSAKKLTEMLEKLVKLEREAYDIGQPGTKPPGDDPLSPLTDNDKARRFLFAIRQAASNLKE
jgi:hypothetical protein